MTNNEINKLCDWVDKNIGRYIGWNEWGSLRVIDPESLHNAIKSQLEEEEIEEGLDYDENVKALQVKLRNMNINALVITQNMFALLK